MDLPKIKPQHSVCFLDLALKDKSDNLLADNFYWLAPKMDVMDWDQYFWFYTPQKQYAYFNALNTMEKVSIEAEKTIKRQGKEWEIDVTLKNPTAQIAFFVEMNAAGQFTDMSILPVFWNDNYVSLAPGESRTYTVKFNGNDLGDQEPVIRIAGMNLTENIVL
jgi:exo-1,4-beta-D-glucosaminidase